MTDLHGSPRRPAPGNWTRALALTLALVAAGQSRADMAPGSQLLLPSGASRAIQDVQYGDALAGTTGSLRVLASLVQPHWGTMLEVETSTARMVVTPGQPFLLASGAWVRAEQLSVDSRLRGSTGAAVPVTAIRSQYSYGGAIIQILLDHHLPGGAAFFADGVAVGDYRRQLELLVDNQVQAPEPAVGCGTTHGPESAFTLVPVALVPICMTVRRRRKSCDQEAPEPLLRKWMVVLGAVTAMLAAACSSGGMQAPSLPRVHTLAAGVDGGGMVSSHGMGYVADDGGLKVTVRGVCWATSESPTIDGDCTTDGRGTGGFSSAVTGLDPTTAYHLRAYATNALGTAYGEDLSFTTGDGSGEPVGGVVTSGAREMTVVNTRHLDVLIVPDTPKSRRSEAARCICEALRQGSPMEMCSRFGIFKRSWEDRGEYSLGAVAGFDIYAIDERSADGWTFETPGRVWTPLVAAVAGTVTLDAAAGVSFPVTDGQRIGTIDSGVLGPGTVRLPREEWRPFDWIAPPYVSGSWINIVPVSSCPR